MQPPTSGSVRIQQQDVFALSPAARTRFRAAQIGYLWQTLELLPYLNVFENTCLSHHADRSTARNWLTRLGLGDRLLHKPDALSHGQRQRVALARALSQSPPLVIADEPTGNLDQRNSAMVFETLRGFADAGGSVLVASHEDLVDSIADESLWIEQESHTVA
jgi:putative ABC transport system ATP-binding protein